MADLWEGYELRSFTDRTGRPYVAPVDSYGMPLALEQVAYYKKRVGVGGSILTTEQKRIITNALIAWKVNRLDKTVVAREAIRVMPRQPGQWPLTMKCVVQWDNTRRRNRWRSGQHWPWKDREEFLAADVGGEPAWNIYSRLDEISETFPALGLGGSNGTPLARRIMTYSDREREKNLRYFERDPLIYSPGKPNGTIRDRMWFEVVKIAEKVLLLHKAGWGKGDVIMATARGRLRGAIVAYAVFVDCYSYLDTPDDVIKFMEKEALSAAKRRVTTSTDDSDAGS